MLVSIANGRIKEQNLDHDGDIIPMERGLQQSQPQKQLRWTLEDPLSKNLSQLQSYVAFAWEKQPVTHWSHATMDALARQMKASHRAVSSEWSHAVGRIPVQPCFVQLARDKQSQWSL